jgi:hypothetical protein
MDHDVRVALGPKGDELMAAANVDVDELIRLINGETTILPVIPDKLASQRETRTPPSCRKHDEAEGSESANAT